MKQTILWELCGKVRLFGLIHASDDVWESVRSLTRVQQGWMLSLSAWISFRQRQSKKLPVSPSCRSCISILILLIWFLVFQWCDTVFGLSFQGEEVWSSQHCPPDWPQQSGQLGAAGRYYWKPETSWHRPAVFVRFRHTHTKCNFKANIIYENWLASTVPQAVLLLPPPFASRNPTVQHQNQANCGRCFI